MSLTKRRRIAAATIVAALALGSAGNAAADEAAEESWQIRGKVHAGGATSDARALPGTVDLLHQVSHT